MLDHHRKRVACLLTLAGFHGLAAPTAWALDAEPPVGYRAVEVQANQFEYNSQQEPALDLDAQGNAFVVWGSRRQEQGTFGIYGRLFDAAGRPLGGEIHVNRFMPNNQERPAVAFTDDGSAWVVWQSFGQDGDMGSIIARRFGRIDDRFSALSDEIIINTGIAGDQTQPAVASSGDRTLIVWTTVRDEMQRIVGRLFTREGAALGDEFSLCPADESHHWLPVVAPQPGGRFIVAWAARSPLGPPAGLFARRVDADGTSLGEVITLAHSADRYDVEPSIDTDRDGRFVASWMRVRSTGGYDVLARRFDVDGDPLGEEVTVASAADGWKSGAAVAVAPDGRFIVSYNAEGEQALLGGGKTPVIPANVMARFFDADGAPVRPDFRVNAQEDGRQILTIASNVGSLAWGTGGRIAVAWSGNTGQDGSGVALTMLLPEGLASARTTLRVDDTLLARGWAGHPDENGMAPPEYDPNHRPDPPDPPFLSPGNDFGFIGFQSTGWTPPDPDLAVGPNHVVVVVNGGIRFYTKDGTLTFEDDISGSNGFWGEVGATSFVFDPVALYDVTSGRYIVATTEHSDSGQDVLNLAVSDDDDPNGLWHKYRYDMSAVGGFIDFPNLGVGQEAIYICTDFFSSPTGNHISIFDKQAMMDGDPTSVSTVQTSGGFRSLAAVKNYDANPPAQYFATSHGVGSSTVQIDAIRDPLGSPIRSVFNLSVPGYTDPPGAEQLGTSNRAATVGRRIKNGVYRNGSLWLVHTIGESSTARVRWYEVEMNGWPSSGKNPTLKQSGTQDLGPGVHNWFGDINVDDAGNMAIAFNQSSSSEYISVQRTFRLATDSPGTTREPALQQTSNSPETGSRWGDYAGLEEDPAQPSVFWNHHEYRTTSWRTWVGRFDILEGLAAIGFAYPDGRPDMIDSAGGTTFTVQVVEQTGVPASGTGLLHVDTGDGFVALAMNDLGDNLYEAVFPPSECGTNVDFYVSAETTEGEVFTDPADAPGSTFSALSIADIVLSFADDFETNQGWTVSGNALDGQWERGVPAGAGDRGDPTTDGDGSGQCYLTDNVEGNSDVDDGSTILTSPLMDASVGDPSVSYWRWYDNSFGNAPEQDIFTVEISNNNGASWMTLEIVGPAGGEVHGGWIHKTFRIEDFLTPTDQMRLRFTASDLGDGSVVEAAVDGVEITSLQCGDTELVDFEVVKGQLLGGDLGDLTASDDQYLTTRSELGFTAFERNLMELTVGAVTGVDPANTIDLTIESRLNNPNGAAKIRLMNWSSNQLEQVHEYPIGLTEETETVTGIDATDRVRASDGRIELSIKHVVAATFTPIGFDSLLDLVEVNVN